MQNNVFSLDQKFSYRRGDGEMEVTKLLNYLKSLSKKKKIYLTLALGCVIFVGLFLLKTTEITNLNENNNPQRN